MEGKGKKEIHAVRDLNNPGFPSISNDVVKKIKSSGRKNLSTEDFISDIIL